MKTNQMMTVKVGEFGTFEIGHLTKMGSVAQVIDMGNQARIHKGTNPIPLEEILRKQEFWEFVIARNTQINLDSKSGDSPDFQYSGKTDEPYSNFSQLMEFKTLDGKIQYSDLIKKFPHLIKSQRGKYGGTWAELYILLKIASMLDKDFEVRIYKTFIEDQILYFRDLGGDNFKEFNRVVDMLLDLNGYSKVDVYQYVAIELRKKQNILDTKGYNEKDHNSKIQETRAKWLEFLEFCCSCWISEIFSRINRTY